MMENGPYRPEPGKATRACTGGASLRRGCFAGMHGVAGMERAGTHAPRMRRRGGGGLVAP
ncbi:hypothetical protein DA2_3119 [Desulfovibrio sp. A2]|nr:hypothetical protein DA2_3119 [Desulfovibrio sp. A2]